MRTWSAPGHSAVDGLRVGLPSRVTRVSPILYIKKISASVPSIILISIQSIGKENPASQSVWQ